MSLVLADRLLSSVPPGMCQNVPSKMDSVSFGVQSAKLYQAKHVYRFHSGNCLQKNFCKNMKLVKKIKSRRPVNAENHSWRKKFPFLWLQKQRKGSGFTHSGQLLPTARSASSQRDCCRAEATWSCPGTQGHTAGAGTSWGGSAT